MIICLLCSHYVVSWRSIVYVYSSLISVVFWFYSLFSIIHRLNRTCNLGMSALATTRFVLQIISLRTRLPPITKIAIEYIIYTASQKICYVISLTEYSSQRLSPEMISTLLYISGFVKEKRILVDRWRGGFWYRPQHWHWTTIILLFE